MKIKFFALLLAFGVSMGLTACMQQSTVPESVQETTVFTFEDTEHPDITIIFASQAEYQVVEVMDRQMEQVGNLLRCIVRLKNNSPGKVPFEYQFQWEDEYGVPILTRAPWQRVTLPQSGQKALVSMGKSVDAARVTMHLRFPKDVQIELPVPQNVQQQPLNQLFQQPMYAPTHGY